MYQTQTTFTTKDNWRESRTSSYWDRCDQVTFTVVMVPSFDPFMKHQGKPDRFWVQEKRRNERKLVGGWRC